ncbi:putative dipeptidyl-peptidase 5 [Zancudomyces culisetae]|uniref:Dipeptidyl-peptidase V n=1 Tax=Zancudomyces culisetae TaxID=1213189 RepID=A0A1R1PSB9_ZANCU|nr:putative dipeptidyl-peptidase 5 [Zancudomyces culisetae]|eukprot:OMH83782.1 putative dipeptidyl-peptidase 5 [Zancudomyces culisetae]
MKLTIVSVLGLISVTNAGIFDAPPPDLPDWSKVERFTPDHLFAIKRLGALSVSPDKKNAVYTQWFFNRTANKVGTSLRVMDIANNFKSRDLTTYKEGRSDTSPVWLDSDTVAFSAVRGSPALNVFTVTVSDNKISQLTNFTNSVYTLVYSSAAKRLAFNSDVYPGLGIDESADKAEQMSAIPYSGVVYDHLFVRHWDTYIPKTRAQLFTLPIDKVDGTYAVTGTPVNVAAGYTGAWGLEPVSFVFSADGKNIAYAAKIPGVEESWSTKNDIFVSPVDASQPPVSVTPNNPGACSAPAYSPDGKYLAWLQMNTKGYESDRNRVMLMDLSTNQVSEVDMGWTLSPGSLKFAEDSKSLFHITGISVDNALFRYDFATKKNTQLSDASNLAFFDELGDNTLLVLAAALSHPMTIFTLKADGAKNKVKVSTENDELLSSLYLTNAYTFKFTGALDEQVEGYMMYPYGYDPSKKYPVAVMIHGGPQQAWLRSFSYAWNSNMYASQGYFTININFHGSPGYGQEFVDTIGRNWGSYPYEDIMKGLDYFLQEACGADADRVVGLGGSYGGYMTNWINGQTDRFKALVNHDGTFSTVSSYYATDELWFMEKDSGTPWIPKEREVMERFNPERYVANWKTPMLIIHGELDYRLPITEGLSTFTALQRRGVDSKLLYFPDENHWVLQPYNGLQWFSEAFQWIGKYTNTTTWTL